MIRTFTRVPFCAAAMVVLAAAGCTEVGRATGETVEIRLPEATELAPGARHWIAWPKARAYCAERGLEPKLFDIKGTVVTYRCIAPG